MVTYTAEETVQPERTIPRALAAGIVLVTVCYVALNAAYLRVLPLAEAARAFGALNGIVLTGPRVYYAMAGDRLAFAWLAAVHPRFRTPARALALQAVWAAALVMTGTYETLFRRVIYTEWIFFALMALGLLRLRKRPAYAPAWRMPVAPLTAVLFAAAGLAVAGTQIASAPLDSALGLGLVLLGLPVFLVWRRRDHRLP